MAKYSIKIEIHEDDRYLCFTPLPVVGDFKTFEDALEFANYLHDQGTYELAERNKSPGHVQR